MFGYVLLFVILPLQRNQRELPSLFLYVTFKNNFHIPINTHPKSMWNRPKWKFLSSTRSGPTSTPILSTRNGLVNTQSISLIKT